MENSINSGLVLTGGSSMLDGRSVLRIHLPTACQLGKPKNIWRLVDVVNNPMYATGVGLVLFERQDQSGKKSAESEMPMFLPGSFV
ncbi:MAG: hypothetical protein R2941_19060 [Desulfobacterales bacterium]